MEPQIDDAIHQCLFIILSKRPKSMFQVTQYGVK